MFDMLESYILLLYALEQSTELYAVVLRCYSLKSYYKRLLLRRAQAISVRTTFNIRNMQNEFKSQDCMWQKYN